MPGSRNVQGKGQFRGQGRSLGDAAHRLLPPVSNETKHAFMFN